MIYESCLDNLNDKSWENLKKIVMFGFGRQGKKIYKKLKKDFDICAIIDNNSEKQGINVDGIIISSLENYLKVRNNEKIIVSVQECNYVQIKAQLESNGLKENIDFVSCQRFITEWYYKYKGKTVIMKTDIPITSKCSLKCENCIMHVPYWKEDVEYSVEDVDKNLNALFKYVDYVMYMDVVGGEPFIFKSIDQLLDMVGSKYSDKIGYFGIVTNGTIIPSESTLTLMKKYNFFVAISDYSDVVPYEKKVNKLCETLDSHQIEYIRNRNIEWFDFGIISNIYNFTDTYTHMKLCNSVCHILDDMKLYYCGVDYSAQKGKIIEEDPNSYVDLHEVDDIDKKKKEILEMMVGNLKGVPQICQKCGGFGVDNKKRVIAGKQL